MVNEAQGTYLKPESQPQNYNEYKTWLNEINSTGKQPTFNAASDMRIKKYVVDTIGNDDVLRKMMMLGFISNGIMDEKLAEIYMLKKLRGMI